MEKELLKIEETELKGVFLVNHINVDDDLYIKYDREIFYKNGLDLNFVQENESFSKKNVLRGLHIQPNKPQGKLVDVVCGEIYDVVVDLRKESNTYKKWQSFIISSDMHKSLYIPEGCAHGFFVKSEYAVINFKVSNYWYPEDEIEIDWNDDELKINWDIEDLKKVIMKKDEK